MGSVRLERARDRTDRGVSHRRVLALTFGPDFIHWRRSGESWPSVWLGRRLFYLMNEPVAAEVEQVWGRSASSGLATGPTGASLTALFATPRARGGGAESGPSFGCFGPGRRPPISIWLDRGRRALTGGVSSGPLAAAAPS
jgi:hypothetical protein